MHRLALLATGLLLGCGSPTEPSEPLRTLALPEGVTLASGQYGLDPTNHEYVVFLGLRNSLSVPTDVIYGLCTFVVAGYAGNELAGERLWSRLLPQDRGCGRELGLVIHLAPQSTGYITVGAVPATVLDGSGAIGVILQLEGENGLRAVRLVEVIVD